jgi:hypothetical protein
MGHGTWDISVVDNLRKGKLSSSMKKSQLKLKSTFTFNKAIAKRLCRTDYYQAQSKNQNGAAVMSPRGIIKNLLIQKN